MNKIEKAIEYFSSGFNCSQSVLTSFKEDFNISEKDLLKISCGFGAGMGRLQKTCGAVTGAYLTIGLKFGKFINDDNDSTEKTYKLVQDFDKEFKNIYKTTNCKKLLNCDLLTESGKKYFIENKLKSNICTKCVADSVKILENLFKNIA